MIAVVDLDHGVQKSERDQDAAQKCQGVRPAGTSETQRR